MNTGTSIYVNDEDEACNHKILSFADNITILMPDSTSVNVYLNANKRVNVLCV